MHCVYGWLKFKLKQKNRWKTQCPNCNKNKTIINTKAFHEKKKKNGSFCRTQWQQPQLRFSLISILSVLIWKHFWDRVFENNINITHSPRTGNSDVDDLRCCRLFNEGIRKAILPYFRQWLIKYIALMLWTKSELPSMPMDCYRIHMPTCSRARFGWKTF